MGRAIYFCRMRILRFFVIAIFFAFALFHLGESLWFYHSSWADYGESPNSATVERQTNLPEGMDNKPVFLSMTGENQTIGETWRVERELIYGLIFLAIGVVILNLHLKWAILCPYCHGSMHKESAVCPKCGSHL